MAEVLFYEKPGCQGNARQKAALRAAGHTVIARDLLSEPWTTTRLRQHFGTRPVREWFNASSPRVRRGEVVPAALDADTALALMLADPLLVRRPLLEAAGRYEAGFDTTLIDAWLGLAPGSAASEGCVHSPGVRCAGGA